jgi:hypothetical protein
MVKPYSAASILFSFFIPFVLLSQTAPRPDRFSVITTEGVHIVVRSADGPYGSFEELPAAVRQSFPRNSAAYARPTNGNESAATTFVVTDAGDAADADINDGTYSPATLRSAIQNANKLGGSHVIAFSPSVTLIQPLSALPSITVNIIIDGSSGTEKVTLDGSLTTASTGITITKPSTVRDMVFKSWKSLGLAVNSLATGSVIKGCEFTLCMTGLNINAANTVVGGPNPDDRNFTYGNLQDGIAVVYANDNIIENNFCGTKDGMTAEGNTYSGIYVLGERTIVRRNLISGNKDSGLEIGQFSKNTLAEENLIGLDSTGRGKLGNSSDGITTFATKDSIINNAISANGYGITVLGQAVQTHIRGNIIGSNRTLDSTFGNRYGGLQILGNQTVIDSNIISCNLGTGVYLTGNGGAVVRRNRIGTDPTGMLDWGNTGPGINLLTDNCIIGGPNAGDRNIISGNGGGGLEVYGGITLSFPGPNRPNFVQGNHIQNNHIGTDITGTQRIPNFTGLWMSGYVDSNFVRDNLISGNLNHGIWTRRSPSAPSRNTFQRNRIGTQSDGTSPLPNDSTAFMIDSAAVNLFGGPDAADANIILHSNQSGIAIKAGWGMDIRRNIIHKNNRLGIDLGNDGPTPNDSSDADTGANLRQNYPRITWIGRNGASTAVKGYLQSRPLTIFRLDFYTNDEADTSGFGEGQTFQTTVDVTTDSAGRAPFSVTVNGTFARVIGTATDPLYGTSEFSKAPLVVNSVANRSDANPTDGLASTSGPQVNGIPEVTLRSALQASNHIAGEDDIAFDIPGTPPHFINPPGALPTATGDVTIDGSTQPGYNPETAHAVQLLGSGAGDDANGLQFSGDRSTVRAMYVAQFKKNGIYNSGELLTLIDVTANGNKRSGIHSLHDVTLEGTSVFNGNGPGALTSDACDTRETAGLWVKGWLRGKGSVTASNNCGPGIRHTDLPYPLESGIDLSASVTANSNSAGGIFALDNVTLKGEHFSFSQNGNTNNDASGIHMASGDLFIEATGGGPNAAILVNNNTSDGIYNALGNVTLKGKAQVNKNGAARTPLEQFNGSISGINAEGNIKTGDLEAVGNGYDGIRSHGSITVNGGLTVKDHTGRGVWATMNITLDGENHLIENNKDQAIWAANGWLKATGTLTVRNNKMGGNHGIEESQPETDALIGSVQAWNDITVENVVIENNEPSGIAGWDNVWIKGTAVVKNNSSAGIFAMDLLRIDGANSLIADNGGDGLLTNNNSILVQGSIAIRGNGKNGSLVADGSGYGAVAQYIGMSDVIAEGNARIGLMGWNGVRIKGQGVVRSNGMDGIRSSHFVEISGGRIISNTGFGIAAPLARISGTQIGTNGLGGVSGKTEGVPTAVRTRITALKGIVQPPQNGIIRGSSITGNKGDGLTLNSAIPWSIEGSNISGNSGFGISNNGPGAVTANGNWWGSAAGPGSALNGSVTASLWRSAAVGLYVGTGADTIFVRPGESDSLTVVAAHWSVAADSISINAQDTKGWLTTVAGRTVVQHDSIPSVLSLKFSVPEGTAAGDTSLAVITGTSHMQPGLSFSDTVILAVYTPQLHRVRILRDTFMTRTGDTLRIIAVGLDQTGREQPIIPLWTATGGTIDHAGRYVAGPSIGQYVLVAADSITGKSDSAVIRILPPYAPAAAPTLSVGSLTLNAGSASPGDTSMTDVKITNLAGSVLRIDSMFTRTAYFTAVRVPDVHLLRVSDTMSVVVLFTPDSARTYHDTLFIFNNSPVSPVAVSLTGSGMLTGADRARRGIPDTYMLHQNYPNPFNPATTIAYGLPERSMVSLKVYDVLGREISALVNGVQEAGNYELRFDGSDLSSGIYFYQIRAGAFVQTNKFILQK